MNEPPILPGVSEDSGDESRRAERERQFTRRRILEVGWTVPIVALTSQLAGQGGEVPQPHVPWPTHGDGGHMDWSEHSDYVTGHEDSQSIHNDARGAHYDSDTDDSHQDVTRRGYHYDGGHADTDPLHVDGVGPHADNTWTGHTDKQGGLHCDVSVHGDAAHYDWLVHGDA